MHAPLDGLLVLDFTRLLPGPFCTQLLANLGADVIKVEDPELGDYMRTVPPVVHGVSYPFLMVNRGKRSLAVDLKSKEGGEILRKLVPRADIVVEQFRPGVMRRLGADYLRLSKINPRLIYCSFSGYGQTGPRKDQPGHDINFQALAGIVGTTGDRGGKPAIPGAPIADLASGFNAALAILAALRTRDATGKGEFIDVSIFDTAVVLMVLGLARFLATGDEPVAGETLLTGTFPFYALYEAKDARWLAVATVEPKFWIRMCEILGVPDMADRQFSEEPQRSDVARTLAAQFRTRTLAEWEAIFGKERLPIVGVKRVSEVVTDPQVRDRRLLPVVNLAGRHKTAVIGHPARHSATRTRNPAAAPAKGQDTESILLSLGYRRQRIEALERTGVIARA